MGDTRNRSSVKLAKDKRNRRVYYDRLSKKGYVVQDKDLRPLSFLSIRYLIAIYFGVMLYFLHVNWLYCLTVTIATGVSGEMYYRFSFLKRMEVSKAFVPEKVNIIDRFSNISRGRMFYNSIICVGCGTALMVNLMRNDVTLAKALSYEDMDVSLLFFSSILIALACLVLLVIQMHLIVSKGYKKAAVRKVVQKRRV